MSERSTSSSSRMPLALPTDEEIRRAVLEKPLAVTADIVRCEQLLARLRRANPLASLLQVMMDNDLLTKSQTKRLLAELTRRGDDPANRNGGIPRSIPGYDILRKLGSGAMAVVYLAKQKALDRQVAIKVLPKRLSANAEFVERFYKEGKAAARLNHPNIVQAIDVGQEPGGFHYFVMEFVEGVTVYDELEKNGPYEEREALRLTIQVARALEHAHEKGFIHRDVKPKNIMVTPDRYAKLADMGLAREKDDHVSAQAEEGKAYGTPYYIAPEQIRGLKDIGFRADIYSLGATLYHMLTGDVPFDGNTPTEVMRKHLKEPLVPPDHRKQHLSSGVGEVIEMMMAKKPEDRYETTKDLLMDLEAIAEGRPPALARQRFQVAQISQLATEDISRESPHVASLHALRAEMNIKMARLRKRYQAALTAAVLMTIALVTILFTRVMG